jgi:hypothetical protein
MLCRFRPAYACLWLALLVSGQMRSAEFVFKPDGRILFQPQLLWANNDTTLQGTGYLIEHKGKFFGVTSIHFLNFDAGGLKSATWVDVATESPVATFRASLGGPLRTSITRMRDAADDFLLLPLASQPEATTVLELEQVAKYAPGTALWFPDKNRDTPAGHTWIDATVVEDAGFWIQVRLAQPIHLQSQSGSPVLNAETGKVIGMLQGAEDENGRTMLYLCPARSLIKHLGRNLKTVPLMTSIRRR